MYFELGQIHYLVFALFGGVLLLLIMLLGYYSWRVNLSRRPDVERPTAEAERDAPEGAHEGNRPIPLLLILVIVVVALWGVAYAVLVAIGVIHVT